MLMRFSARGYLLARVRHIVSDEGFQVNESKTRVLRRNTAQTVTGVVVNSRPGRCAADSFAAFGPSCTAPRRKAWPPRTGRTIPTSSHG